MPAVLANLIWPALFLVERMNAVVPILVGLVVEILFLRYATGLRGLSCVSAGVGMNVSSALLGVLLIPLAGLGWEVVSAVTIQPLFKVGTFNPASWVATALLAAAANALVEGYTLRRFFGVLVDRRLKAKLAAVNLVTVALGCLSLYLDPARL
jgi:hypothetical protein